MKIRYLLIALLGLVISCGSGKTDSQIAYEDALNANAAAAEAVNGTNAGTFKWSYYYTVSESDYVGPQDTPLTRKDNTVIAYVRSEFYNDLAVNGTGYLADGTLVNQNPQCGYSATTSCFMELDTDDYPYGIGSSGKALDPFRTVAANPSDFTSGTKLYIPLLKGKAMPGDSGFLHDGCVTVGDVGLESGALELFALTNEDSVQIDSKLDGAIEVEVYEDSANCE